MSTKILTFILLIFIVLSCKTEQSAKESATPEDKKLKTGDDFELKELVKANNAFALDIFKKMAGADNLFISPFSISSVLAMTFAGASADTESEMSKTMHWPANTENFHKAYGSLNAKLQKDAKIKEFTINLANRLFTNKDVELYSQFAGLNKNAYGAAVQNIDFSKTEEAAKIINSWVSEKTQKMIPDLLKPSSLDGAQLVLVNAVYFYGGWAMPFEKSQTVKASFKESSEKSTEVDFMNKTWDKNDSDFRFTYFQNEKFQVLELPYHENKGSMVILLPQTDSSGNFKSLNTLLKELSSEELQKMLDSLSSFGGILDLKLPKWKQTSKSDLVSFFKDLGMTVPFSNADFSRISPTVHLQISAIIHEAVIEVSEKGTKAAASTAVETKATSAPMDPEDKVVFHANHPFIYLIRDNSTGSILFIGQMCKP